MSIHVALIDRSEIVQKMLSHCLHYFSAEIFRFDSLEDSQAHFSDKKPDIVFVDWEIKKGDKAVIYSALEEFQKTPVVLLYRESARDQLAFLPPEKIPYKIKKPLAPKAVRDILTELVSEVGESKIHSFLKFPQSPEEKAKASASKEKTSARESLQIPKRRVTVSKDSFKKTEGFSDEDTKLLDKAKEKTQTFFKQTFSGIFPLRDIKGEKEDPNALKTALPVKKAPPMEKTSSTGSQEPFTSKKPDQSEDQKVKDSLPETEKSRTYTPLMKKEKTANTILSGLNKEDINIDEDTQNDLAPMAIKSSIAQQPANPASVSNMELSEKDILRVLNKYKDSLEFEELMEKVLSEYAQQTVTNILQEEKVTDLLQQPLTEFKESQKFKELVEREISQYVKKHLPLLIKELVEREIKNIIGD